jgi:four helix bundle protein
MKRKKSSIKNRILWEKSLQLVLNIKKMKKQFLNEEMFGLSPLLTRASTEVSSYIGEACDEKDFRLQLRLLSLAQRALIESRSYLVNVQRFGNTNKLGIEAEQVSVILESSINALRK